MAQLLTTVDNPFDPFDQPDEWLSFDLVSGYRTNQLLARFAVLSTDWSDSDYENEINRAMEEIVQLLPFYKIVKRDLVT